MENGAGRSFEQLVSLVSARAREEGRAASVLPGLWFFRYSQPMPPKPARSTLMYLGVAVQGRKVFHVRGQELVYDRRSYLVLRGETDYRASPVVASPEEPYLALGIQLPPELVVRTLLELGESAVPSPQESEAPLAFISPLEPALVDALCRLVLALDDPRERRVLAPLVLREIVFRLFCTEAAAVLRQAAAGNGERDRIRSAMEHIEAHAHQRLTVDGIARRVAMSPSHFAHRFKEIASISPMRYLKHVRMERARELLLTNGLGAAEIAERVGYASASHFTRDFKRHFGLAPARYARAFETGATVSLGSDATE